MVILAIVLVGFILVGVARLVDPGGRPPKTRAEIDRDTEEIVLYGAPVTRRRR